MTTMTIDQVGLDSEGTPLPHTGNHTKGSPGVNACSVGGTPLRHGHVKNQGAPEIFPASQDNRQISPATMSRALADDMRLLSPSQRTL